MGRRNDGVGGVNPRPDSGYGSFPISATRGEFDEDCKAELATVDYWSNHISMPMGSGEGTYSTASSCGPLPSFPASIGAGIFQWRASEIAGKSPGLSESRGLDRVCQSRRDLLQTTAYCPVRKGESEESIMRAYRPFIITSLTNCSSFSHRMARPARFERATFGFGGQHSIQLSYGRKLLKTQDYHR